MHWVYLNEEGKKLYGGIFPEGQLPVISMIPQLAKLGDLEKVSQVYLIRVGDLTSEQFTKIVDLVVKNLGGSRADIERDFKEHNIPLRAELTSGSGTDNIGFFLPDFNDEDECYEDYDEEEEVIES